MMAKKIAGWTQSEPPRSPGWGQAQRASYNKTRWLRPHPLPRGGTDCVQVQRPNKTSARWISPSPRRRNFRVSVALTPSRKIVRTTVCAKKMVESGERSTMCPSSGEDGNLTAYYHGAKKRPCYPNLNH